MRRRLSHGLFPLARAALTAVAALCLACSSRSPREEILDQARNASSWIATLQMTGERWSANTVPASFVEATTDAARTALAKEAADARGSRAPAAMREPFLRTVAAARDAGSGLRRAAQAGNRPAAVRWVSRLAALQAELASLRGAREESAP